MIFLPQGMIGELSNRMACDLFHALDFRELGCNNIAEKLEERIPGLLTQQGIDKCK